MSTNLIAELFLKDPLEYTAADIPAIVEHFRKNRVNFNTAHAKTSSAAQTKKLLAAEEKAKAVGVNLDSIDLGL